MTERNRRNFLTRTIAGLNDLRISRSTFNGEDPVDVLVVALRELAAGGELREPARGAVLVGAAWGGSRAGQ